MNASLTRSTSTYDTLGRPACSFTSTEAASLFKIVVPRTNWFVCRWILVVLCSKSPLNHHDRPVAMRGETIRASRTFSHKKTMVKDIPIICHEAPRGMWMQGCTYLCIHSHGTRKR